MFDKAGIAVDIAGSALHVARSMGHIVAGTVGIELHPNMGRRGRGHMPAPVLRGRLEQASPSV